MDKGFKSCLNVLNDINVRIVVNAIDYNEEYPSELDKFKTERSLPQNNGQIKSLTYLPFRT